jgi:hypothetical protein
MTFDNTAFHEPIVIGGMTFMVVSLRVRSVDDGDYNRVELDMLQVGPAPDLNPEPETEVAPKLKPAGRKLLL